MTWLGGLALVRFLPWSHHCHQNCHIKRKSSTLSHASGWDLRRIWAGPHPEIIERPWDSPHPLFSSQKLSFVNKELFFFFLSFDHLTSSFSLFPCLLPRSVPVVLSDRACLPTDNGNSSDRVEFPWGVLNQTLGPIGAQKGNPPTIPPVMEAHVAFHHPSVGIERVQTGQSAFICPPFPFRVMRPAKVSQVLVM